MSDAGTAGAGRSIGQKVKRTVESKVLVPLAATAVSAGVSYLARKLPLILEEKVLPKLREKGAPQIADKVESVASVLPGAGSPEASDGGEERGAERADESSGPDDSGPSNDEREAERQKREQRRQERKRALSSA